MPLLKTQILNWVVFKLHKLITSIEQAQPITSIAVTGLKKEDVSSEQSGLASLKKFSCCNRFSYHNLLSFVKDIASVVQPNFDFIEFIQMLAFDGSFADFTEVYFKMPWFNDFEYFIGPIFAYQKSNFKSSVIQLSAKTTVNFSQVHSFAG